MVKLSDEELVKKIKQGEISAFETLVVRYEPKLIGYVMKKMNEVKDAEEVVQDSFVKVYRNIGRIDDKRRFASYLFTVVDNEVIDRFRRKREVLPLFDGVVESDESEIIEKIVKEEKAVEVRKRVDSLSEKHRMTLKMYYFDDFSYKMIAERLKMPINSVKTNIKRAREALYKMMKNEK